MNSSSPMTIGFTVSGTTASEFVLRFSGPSYSLFGIPNTVGDPKITVFRKDTQVGYNDDWVASLAPSFASAGLFPYLPGSKDAALKLSFLPGDYLARFDFDDSETKRGLVELSALGDSGFSRGYVESTSRNDWALGLMISDTTDMLFRARGMNSSSPSDPRLSIQSFGSSGFFAENDNWGASPDSDKIESLSAAVGFPELGKYDSAILRTIPSASVTSFVKGYNLNVSRFEFADLKYQDPVSTPDVADSILLSFGSLSVLFFLRNRHKQRPN